MERAEADPILVDVTDAVATVTLNRPEARNALSPRLLSRLYATLEEVDRRDDVAAIVLTGADPAFCAGLDLKAVADGELIRSQHGQDAERAESLAGVLPFDRITKPLIGAINGTAITGGLELALGCDVLIASERARFADTHARVGVMPGWGLTVLLPQAIGLRRAREMSFTGNFVDATTALAWGLLNRVVPHEDLLAVSCALGADMASVPRPNLLAIKGVYAAVEREQSGAALAREQELSREWAKTFDRAGVWQLAESRFRRGVDHRRGDRWRR